MPRKYARLAEFPRYLIGDDGTVFTERYNKTLTPLAMGNYLGLQLVNKDGNLEGRYIHRLVLQAFVGPPEPGMETRHLNGDRLDNRLANLKWGTPLENAEDKRRHGVSSDGERNGQAKLTPDLVREIRRRVACGEMQKDVAAEIGMSKMAVSRVVRRESWAGVR